MGGVKKFYTLTEKGRRVGELAEEFVEDVSDVLEDIEEGEE